MIGFLKLTMPKAPPAPAMPKADDSPLKKAIRAKLAEIIGEPSGMLSQFTGIIEAGLNMMDEGQCQKLAASIVDLGDDLKPLLKCEGHD